MAFQAPDRRWPGDCIYFWRERREAGQGKFSPHLQRVCGWRGLGFVLVVNGTSIYVAYWNSVILVSAEQCHVASRKDVDLFTNYDEVVQVLHLEVGKNPRQLSYADMRTPITQIPIRDDRRADERRHDRDLRGGKRRHGGEYQSAEAPNASSGSGITAEERA